MSFVFKKEKKDFILPVGTKISTWNMYTDSKKPYTVVGYKSGKIQARACKLIFHGDRYFDTLPDEIIEDPYGELIELTWSPKREAWIYKPGSYAQTIIVDSWEYEPYTD